MRTTLIVSSLALTSVVMSSSFAVVACDSTTPPEAHPAGKTSGKSPDESDGDGAGKDNQAPKGETCGDGKCSAPSETCDSCPQDCGVCTVCPLTRSCTTGSESPSSITALPSLNIGFEAITKERLTADLIARAQAGDPALLLLDAVVRASDEGEGADAHRENGANVNANANASVRTSLRTLLAKYPRQAHAIRAALARTEVSQPLFRARLRSQHDVDTMTKRADDDETESKPSLSHLMSNESGDGGVGAGDASAGGGGGKPISCDAPKLRIRVASVTAKELDDDIAGDIIFCSIAARSRAVQNPIRMLQKTPNLSSKQTHVYAPSEGMFWGIDKPTDPGGDLEIRYDCFEEDRLRGYEEFVAAVAKLVEEAGGTFLPGGYGYVVSTVADLIRDVLPSILALDADDHLFSASQVIPRSQQLELAKGAKWSVRKKGTHLWSDWDWRLDIESYGCSDNGIAP